MSEALQRGCRKSSLEGIGREGVNASHSYNTVNAVAGGKQQDSRTPHLHPPGVLPQSTGRCRYMPQGAPIGMGVNY